MLKVYLNSRYIKQTYAPNKRRNGYVKSAFAFHNVFIPPRGEYHGANI